jgi:uncharacterized protein (DUF1499 family)
MRQPPPPPFSKLARSSQRIAALAALLLSFVLIAVQIGWLAANEALTVFSIGIAAAVLAVVLAIAGLVVIWKLGSRGAGRAIAALFLAAAVLAYPAFLGARAIGLPPINDVSTDVESPVTFDAASDIVARRGGYTPAVYADANAESQRLSYPAIRPLILDLPQLDAANLVATRLQALGLTITRDADAAPMTGGVRQVEAIDRSLLLRMVDDVAVRLTALSDDETRIDIRSASRLGRHDLGVNASRIQRILDDLTEAAQQE